MKLKIFGFVSALVLVFGVAFTLIVLPNLLKPSCACAPDAVKDPEAEIARANNAAKSILDFTVKDIDGKAVKLGKYKGKVLLIVNTASKCGYTPQYKGLQETYTKYNEQGFEILGFPANNFGGQEPGTEAEIKEFCTLRYKVTFPMFAKISVKGEDQHPLYKFLTSEAANLATKGEVSWNFNKFLVDRKGKVIARFSSKDAPDGEAVTKAIEEALAKK